MGRPPKPTKLKLFEGNAGKRALPRGEPLPIDGIGAPPDHMCDSEKSIWFELLGEQTMRVTATARDRSTFEQLVHLMWQSRELKRMAIEQGPHTQFGADARSAIRDFHKLAQAFGLDPVSRVKLATGLKDTGDALDQWESGVI